MPWNFEIFEIFLLSFQYFVAEVNMLQCVLAQYISVGSAFF